MTRRKFFHQLFKAGLAIILGARWLARKATPPKFVRAFRVRKYPGSLMSLQLTNASAGVIVLVGTAVQYKSYLNKLVGRYSATRLRVWSQKDVNELYNRVIKK